MNKPIQWLAVACIAAAATSHAADGAAVPGYWLGVEGGASTVRQSFTGGSANSTNFSLAFHGGLVVSPELQVGAELGGILLEPSDLNDPSRGRGISQAFGIAQYRANGRRDGIYVKAGLGYASFWGNHPSDSSKSGWGGSFAVGHDFAKGAYGAFGPVLTITGGSAGGISYRAASLGINWSFP